jgi:hypothetical protein
MLFFEPDPPGTVTSDHAGSDGDAGGDRVVDILGVEVVIEADFVTFPWRAGIRRAPLAFLASFALVALLSAFASVAADGTPLEYLGVVVVAVGIVGLLGYLTGLGSRATRWHGLAGGAGLLVAVALLNIVVGTGQVPFADQFAILAIITYNAHNIHAATGLVPGVLAPVADPVAGVPVLGRLLQGLVAVGQDHAAPLTHVTGIAGGETTTIGHVNLLEQQGTRVPKLLYYLVPVAALAGSGYEYARTHWENAASDAALEMVRFGIALGLGYVATLLVGTVVFTYKGQSPLDPQVYTVMPDRYLTVVFGFVYPAVLVSLGAAIVYIRREL